MRRIAVKQKSTLTMKISVVRAFVIAGAVIARGGPAPPNPKKAFEIFWGSNANRR